MGPCPSDFWWNSTPFWPLTLVCSLKGSEVTKSRVDKWQTRDGHVSRVWDHAHWIPGEILTILHVKHFTVAQSSQKLAKTWHVTRDTWRSRVTCLGPWPLDSWWNSDLFTCKTLYCRSPGTRVRYYTLLEALAASSGLQRPNQTKWPPYLCTRSCFWPFLVP